MEFLKKMFFVVVIFSLMLPSVTVFGAEISEGTKSIEDNGGITPRNGAELIDDYTGGKMLNISSGWISGSNSPSNGGGLFNDADQLFNSADFSLYANVYISMANGNDALNTSIFLIGNPDNHFRVIPKGANGKGSLEVVANGSTYGEFELTNPIEEGKWTGFGLVYNEDGENGNVSIFMDGEKILDSQDIGFKLSQLENVDASIGTTYKTGFMRMGKYDDIVVLNKSASDSEAISETENRVEVTLPIYDYIRPGQEWLDTEGNLIEAHGGSVQRLNEAEINFDVDKDGKLTKDYWFWYGEEKTSATRPVEGVKAYVSEDLYNWKDMGTVLPTHDKLPVRLNESGNALEYNPHSLEELKEWGNLTEPSENVTEAQITMAKNFLEAYVTDWEDRGYRIAAAYDEENLQEGFENLYGRYNIVERPKMLYNKQTGKFVIAFHSDGPQYDNESLVNWVKRGANPDDHDTGSRYGKAQMGFAISDTPFGPFKLVNATRMNWTEGVTPSNRFGEARDFTVFVDYGKDVNNDGIDDAYAIYSSEMNAEMYVSLLNDQYTGPTVDGGKATPGVDYNYRALPDKHREASSVFYYDGYYYMLTSGTDGWNSTDVIYYRSKSMILTVGDKWEKVGDPFAEPGTKGYDSQPTYVITVDQEKGQFIYMGDRWRLSSNGSAGPNSRYVWFPIEFGVGDDITIRWYDKWDLNDVDNTGKIDIITELPNVTNLGEIPKLPEEVELSINNKQQTVPINWKLTEDLFKKPGSVTVVGELPSLGREISQDIQVIPSNVIYFVNPSIEPTEDYQQMTFYMAETLLNKDVSDQPYDTENGNTWGYSGGKTEVRNGGTDIFSTLRYISEDINDEKNINYTFELDNGNYTIYAGFFDPWNQWANGNRKADVTINGVLVDSEYTFSDQYDVREYDNIDVTDGILEFNIQPSPSVIGKSNSDSQISWIMVVTNEVINDTDKSSLQSLYDANKNKNKNEYTDASWTRFEEALAIARAVLEDGSATQVEIDNAETLLSNAIDQLELKTSDVNKTALQALYDANKDKEKGDYTEASWTEFQTVLAIAKNILEKVDATQVEVDHAKIALQTAIDALMKDNQDGTEDQDGSDDQDGTNDQDGKVDQDDSNKDNVLPSTATSTFNFLLMGSLLLVAGIIILSFSFRKWKKV